jgi:hypothetical protein
MIVRLFKTIYYVLCLRCEEADRIRCVCHTGDLTRAERLGEWLHTLLCRSCWKARKQLKLLGTAVEKFAKDASETTMTGNERLSNDAKSRILGKLGDIEQ